MSRTSSTEDADVALLHVRSRCSAHQSETPHGLRMDRGGCLDQSLDRELRVPSYPAGMTGLPCAHHSAATAATARVLPAGEEVCSVSSGEVLPG